MNSRLFKGSPYDLFSSISPNLSAHGSFGSFLYSSPPLEPLAYLAANLAAFASALEFYPFAAGSPPSFFSFLAFFGLSVLSPPFSSSALPFPFPAPPTGAPHDFLISSEN